MIALHHIRRALHKAWNSGLPKSLFTLAKERRSRSKLPTAKLYVVQTDFELSPDTYNGLQAMLDPIREKYDLDFLILEPGYKLKRFDDY